MEPEPDFLAGAGDGEKAPAPTSSDNSCKIYSHFDNLYTNLEKKRYRTLKKLNY